MSLFSFAILDPQSPADDFLLAYSLIAVKEQKGFRRVEWICEKWRGYLGQRPIGTLTRVDISLYIDHRRLHESRRTGRTHLTQALPRHLRAE